MADINFFGITNFRNSRRKFGIKTDDRRRHFYAIGKTGMGKTEMLKNMAVQDIQNGHGMGFVDPHGEAVEDLLDFVPQDRVQDVVYFNPADTHFPIAFNVMEQVDPENRHMVASGLMSVFKKIWPDVWSARMEYILNNVVLALLECPDSTLLGINRMLVDPEYRQQVVEQVKDPVVKTFWVQEYARYTQRYEVEATAAIQNKVGQFTSNPLIRNIVGQIRSSMDMREVMDGKKILLVNISKGRIGEDNSRLIGGLLITKLQLAAMSRVDIPEDQRQDFFLYIDEFQHFATESFVNILSEARKYRLSLVLSHQYIAQLGTGTDAPVRDAVFGNVGTIVSFRIGAEDAEWMEKEFMPEFIGEDFVNLAKYTIYVKLMIDGVSSRPFSANTMSPPMHLPQSFREQIIAYSRNAYGTKVGEVEEQIRTWSGLDEQGQAVRAAATAPRPVIAANPQEQVLYDARCSNCGRDTKVVFPPDGKRPVYCKACRKKLKRQQEPAESPSQSREASLGVEAPPRRVEAPAPRRKAVANREELQSVLQQALQKRGQKTQPVEQASVVPKQPEQPTQEKGVLEPGQTVYFDR
ncbi:MAG TPA: type IV secretion system DNA-binding domain-containing protein [Candidatus Paceibacterota bacterium]